LTMTKRAEWLAVNLIWHDDKKYLKCFKIGGAWETFSNLPRPLFTPRSIHKCQQGEILLTGGFFCTHFIQHCFNCRLTDFHCVGGCWISSTTRL